MTVGCFAEVVHMGTVVCHNRTSDCNRHTPMGGRQQTGDTKSMDHASITAVISISRVVLVSRDASCVNFDVLPTPSNQDQTSSYH